MTKEKLIIRKVWAKKATNQLLITIPRDVEIEAGDYVRVEKVE